MDIFFHFADFWLYNPNLYWTLAYNEIIMTVKIHGLRML